MPSKGAQKLSKQEAVDTRTNTLKEAAWNYKMALYRALYLWLPSDLVNRVLRDPILATAHDQLLAAIKPIDAEILNELDARNAMRVGMRLGRLYPSANVGRSGTAGTYGWCCLEWWALQGDQYAKERLLQRG